MLLFSWLNLENVLSPVLLAITDAVLLSLLIAIPIYHLVVRPLKSTIRSSQTKLNMLASAIENAGDGIVITTRKGKVEYVNKALLRMSHYDEGDVVGEHVSKIEPYMSEEPWKQAFLHDIKHYGVWNDERWDTRKNGEQYLSEITVTPIDLDDSGVTTHFVTIKQDNTKRHELEEQLRQAQKMEAVGTLVGGIAHDFNNMLSGITGQLYLTKAKVVDNPHVLERISKMEALSFRAADMVSQLFTFARKGAVNKVNMELNSFLKEAMKLASVGLPENIDFKLTIDDSPELSVNADATQLQQVTMNLINNARDAVEGSDNPVIAVSVKAINADSPLMDKFDTSSNAYACLCIRDNGCGIEKENLLKITEPFFTTKEQGKGTGLGLAMVHGAIETHNGFIDIKSTVGTGTEICIFIPLEGHGEITPSSKLECIYKGHGETILLVDDDVSVREVGKEVLEQLGYKVFIASDGIGAIDTYTQYSNIISAIVMDVVMPRLQGTDAALKIKKHNPNLPIILVTGYDKGNVIDDEMRQNIDAVICKPFSTSKLSDTLHNLLSE